MDEDIENEERINMIILGDSSVGKSSFIIRYTENQFQDEYLATIGIDFRIVTKKIRERQYKLFFYDTMGQEKYKSVALNIIKLAEGVILIYDITNGKSFDSIPNWIEKIQNVKGNKFPLILCGNKVDEIDKRQVSIKEGEELANKFKIKFFETSNKDGTNIDEAVLCIIDKILYRRQHGNLDLNSSKSSTKLSRRSAKSVKLDHSKKCC